jgi:hypothetical protein
VRGTRLLECDARFYSGTSSLPLSDARPTINVLALSNTQTLYASPLEDVASQAMDDALELASHLQASPPAVAAAGGWAALEALLTSGADTNRAVAADRAATLVTASWPRAELTRLSHRLSKASDCDPRLAEQLRAVGDHNLSRSEVTLNWFRGRHAVPSLDPTDQAAVLRLAQLIDHPSQVLKRVHTYCANSFRRLYRQRNLVLHGGATMPVALPATIRTAGPLVGAALDRVAHALELENVEPLDAVARADCAIRAVGDDQTWPLHKLTLA